MINYKWLVSLFNHNFVFKNLKTMAKTPSVATKKNNPTVTRKGVHAKSGSSKLKTSKKYNKRSVGQG